MAGGTNEGQQNWLNVSQGHMVNRKAGVSLDWWEGHITSIRKKEGEYNGEPKVDVQMGMIDHDSGETCMISFNAESPFARGFFARIEQIDVKRPVRIGVMPWIGDGKDKAVSLCYVIQGGVKIDPRKDFPNAEKVLVGKKEIKDWTHMNQETDRIVWELQEKLGAAFAGNGSTAPKAAIDNSVPPPELQPVDKNSDLPF